MTSSIDANLHKIFPRETNRRTLGESPHLPSSTPLLAVSVSDFCSMTSLGRTLAFQLIREKRVEVRRVNGRTLILMRSVHALLELSREVGS